MTLTQLPSDDDTITIKRKEYTRLQERDQWLECLEAAGVDNWDGYEYAQELLTDVQERNAE
jgi:hypothetical protein